jgi:hypothetical protein
MDEDGEAPSRTWRYVVWTCIAVALGVGVALALKYGPLVIPLLDTVH